MEQQLPRLVNPALMNNRQMQQAAQEAREYRAREIRKYGPDWFQFPDLDDSFPFQEVQNFLLGRDYPLGLAHIDGPPDDDDRPRGPSFINGLWVVHMRPSPPKHPQYLFYYFDAGGNLIRIDED